MTIVKRYIVPYHPGPFDTLAPKLNNLDTSIKQDVNFKINVTNKTEIGMAGTLVDSKNSYNFMYTKPDPNQEEAYGALTLDGRKHVFSHNNYMVLRNALEQSFKTHTN